MLAYIDLLRPYQWYKNLLVFLPVFFVGGLFDPTMVVPTVLAFLALCAVSSCNYILNDYLDIDKDRQHPEKRHRPLASGKVNSTIALVVAALLLGCGSIIAQGLGNNVFYSVVGLFLLSGVYSLLLKHVLFADVLVIATNFVIRAVTGAFAISVIISPWLVLCTFLLALFLAVGKRHADLLFLKKDAKHHRATLEHYTPEITSALLILSTTAFTMSYSLYSLSRHEKLLVTIPFALYVLFRYFWFIYTGNKIARHPEKIIKDLPIIIGIALWVGTTLAVLYI